MHLTFSDTWELLSESPITYFQSNPLSQIAYSADKNYFIPNNNGTLYNAEGDILNSIYDTLDDKGIGYDFIFLENESALMNLTNPLLGNNAGIRNMNKYSFPDIELIDSWNVENITGLAFNYNLFYDGEILLLSYNLLSSGDSRVVVIPITL